MVVIKQRAVEPLFPPNKAPPTEVRWTWGTASPGVVDRETSLVDLYQPRCGVADRPGLRSGGLRGGWGGGQRAGLRNSIAEIRNNAVDPFRVGDIR